ncbi:MAG: zf-TFIIB domain-containing protein [Gammaproteobacteria bacterium]|nr:zf-TFIIB domain-containing protein [Gammaproteobacteria bacterium]
MVEKRAKVAEDKYFERKEYEHRKKKLDEDHKKLKTSQRKELKKLHYMRCPKCGMELVEIDFKGIEIDKCSECGGIYLDNGELELLLKPKKKKLLDHVLHVVAG